MDAHAWGNVQRKFSILRDSWKAIGWLLNKVERTIAARRNPLAWNVGLVVAPLEAVGQAGHVL